MPWQDPNGFFRALYECFMTPQVQAVLAALVFSVLRILSDKNNGSLFCRGNIIECLLCISVTWCCYKLVPVFGLSPDLGVPIGGAIGYFGTKWLDKLVRTWAEKKAGSL